ncbi:MAG TPA: homoserine dehydrogenase [Candidatus Binatia bacterium]|nr:homoserine dehydrogenase [Candidatus Binatia bacterium]
MATALSRFERPHHLADSPCRVALVGFGTVGSAVARQLHARRHEDHLQLTHVCNRHVARKKVNWMGPDVVWVDSIQQVLASDADVVVELMGGLEPAHSLVRRALESGKSVVTANKQLMAHFGSELLKLAGDSGAYLGFGACVAGGVPVLSALQDGLAGDRLVQVRGILNGTCNYILTRIGQSGASFEQALREAQQAGFAEADPTDDIDGKDAAAKLAILARIGLRIDAAPEHVVCRSIRSVAAIDFEYADELGCTIRQISTARLHEGKAWLAVEPALVPYELPFADIRGSQNLVVSTGEFGGETSFGGHGAGGDPTAVAVISDLMQAARHRANGAASANHHFVARCELTHELQSPHYLRFVVRDRPGIIAALSTVLAKHDMNLDAVLQKPGHPKSALPFVITLEPCSQRQLSSALAEIGGFDFLAEAPLTMPILQQEHV